MGSITKRNVHKENVDGLHGWAEMNWFSALDYCFSQY